MTQVTFRQAPHGHEAHDASPSAAQPADDIDGWDLLPDAMVATPTAAASHVGQWEVITAGDRQVS